MTKSLQQKKTNKARRIHRIRTVVSGTPNQPRLAVNFSSYNVYAQLIDDSQQKTLISASSLGQKLDGNLTNKATWVGNEIAALAKKAKIKHVALDRRGKKYHGRVKALADAARKSGLEF